MSDLKTELASLRIDRDRPKAASRRWPLLLLFPAFVLLAALYAMRAGGSRGGLEVETVQAVLVPGGTSAGGAAILTASGYVVARRKAVVSAKIQGRLADLRVEEGDRVREGELIARLESGDYQAQVQRALALLLRAEADLAENERLLRQANDLARQQIASRDQVDVAESRVRIAQAAMAQARAEVGYAQAQMQNTRILALHSKWSGESFVGPYQEKGRYVPAALAEINHLLRDRHNNAVRMIDVRLLDLLHDLKLRTQYDGSLEIVCGYRSAATNKLLRKKSKRVAKDSLHIKGQAVDIRLNGIDLSELRQTALAMQAGGVGYYPRQNFIHVDVGPLRTW